MAAFQIVAADLHFLAGKVVEGQVDFQLGVTGEIAIGIAADNLAQRLQRLLGLRLVAADTDDVVVIGLRDQMLGVGRILVGRIQVEITPRRRPRAADIPRRVGREGRHDDRPFRQLRERVEPFDLVEGLGRLDRFTIGQLRLADQEDIARRRVLQRDIVVVAEESAADSAAAMPRAAARRIRRSVVIRRVLRFAGRAPRWAGPSGIMSRSWRFAAQNSRPAPVREGGFVGRNSRGASDSYGASAT